MRPILEPKPALSKKISLKNQYKIRLGVMNTPWFNRRELKNKIYIILKCTPFWWTIFMEPYLPNII